MKVHRLIPVVEHFLAIALLSPSLPARTEAATLSFSSPVNYPVGTTPVAVAVGDFNGDGKPDLAVANVGSANVSILLGKGDGTFQPAVNYSVGPSPGSVAEGDFNGDLEIDVAVSNGAGGTVSVLLGNGDGTFRSAVTYSVGQSPQWVAVADFDTDNNLDLAVANHGDPIACNDGTVSMLLGKGDGTFQSAANFEAGPCPFSVAAGDLNADGKLDLVTQADALIGEGNGTFQSPTIMNWGSGQGPGPVAVADFNRDGKQDLAGSLTVAEFTRRVKILLGNGDGTFQSAATYNGGLWPDSIAVADFDLDGALDLATTSVNTTQVSILTGNGDGTFQPPVSFAVGSQPASVASGDFNGDNLPDLVVTNRADNTVGVLLNNSIVERRTLSVALGGGGGGTVTSNPAGINCGTGHTSCVAQFVKGTTVTLTASPDAGSVFVEWNTDCSGSGTCRVTMDSDHTVSAFFQPLPDFFFTVSAPTPASVEPGQSVTSTIIVASLNGFSGTVSFTCSVQPASALAPTCSALSLTPPVDNSATGTLAIHTIGPAAALVSPRQEWPPFYAIWLLPLAGVAFVRVSATRRKRATKRSTLCLLGFILFAGLIFQSACGGGSSTAQQHNGGTPPGAYTINVTGTSGSIRHSATMTLTVQ